MTSSQLSHSVDNSMDLDDKHPIDLSARITQPTLVPSPQPFPAPFFAQQANQAGPHPESDRAMIVERSSSNPRLNVIQIDGKSCFFCKICKTRLTSLISLRQHESGKRHQSMLTTEKLKEASAAISPVSSFGEDNVSSSYNRHSPTQYPLKDRSNSLDILDLEPSLFAEHNPTKNLLPLSRLNPNVSDQKLPVGSTVKDCREKKQTNEDLPIDSLENDSSFRIEPERINVSSRSSICGLKVRDVLKRVCLTQMISLLSDRAGSPLPVTNSFEDEQILLQTLTGLCNGTLSNRSSNNHFDETVESRFLSPNQLARDFLLLSWCQQLAMLDK